MIGTKRDLSNLQVLQEMRPIIQQAPNEHACIGCLEDALLRVVWGVSWWANSFQTQSRNVLCGLPILPHAEDMLRDNDLVQHPVYVLLKRIVNNDAGAAWGQWNFLYSWSDQHSKAERLSLIDRAIATQQVPS